MRDTDANLLEKIVGVALGGTIIAAHIALDGYVISSLWGWFMPALLGVKPISWAMAMGINTLLSALIEPYRPKLSYKGEALTEDGAQVFKYAFLRPAKLFVLGYVFKLMGGF